MATTITNRASLRYTYGDVTETVASNLASTVLNDPLTVAKAHSKPPIAAERISPISSRSQTAPISRCPT